MPAETEHETVLRSGTLRVRTSASEIPLENLCGFGSRRSRRRGFVFVSKVLGKHWPVRPRHFQDCCDRLAAKLTGISEPAVMVAMAETATGLGHGIFESLLNQSPRTDLLFLHGTRYKLSHDPLLTFDESHSHASRHWLYGPDDDDDRRLFHSATTLIIVDDEMTTGSTAANLALAYRRLNPQLRRVVLVCLTDWMDSAARTAVTSRIGVETEFVHLLRGQFSFDPNHDFDPGPPVQVDGDDRDKSFCLPVNFGRRGLRSRLELNEPSLAEAARLKPGSRLLVLGTGEFHYPAFRLARWLEDQGWDVHFQSTTRSPLMVDADLTSALEFVDNYHEQIPNFLYNFTMRAYDQVLIGYETRPIPHEHRLCEMLDAIPIHFA